MPDYTDPPDDGRPWISFGPHDLQAESEVTPEDRSLAQRFWAKYATPLLKRLLNARKANQ